MAQPKFQIEIQRVEAGPDVEASPIWRAAYEIRQRVFIQEQRVPPELELENERESYHYLLRVDGEPAGCGRWRETEQGHKIERVAVLPIYRGLSIGREIMLAILADLRAIGSHRIFLASQLSAAPFYEKLGFSADGPEFFEAGIPHVKMYFKET